MDAFILDFLGPYTKWVMAFSLGLVVIMRKSIRKRHIVALLVATVLSFIAFFLFLLWGFVRYDGTQPLELYHAGLRVMAGIGVGCGAAIGYCFILKSLGLASLEE